MVGFAWLTFKDGTLTKVTKLAKVLYMEDVKGMIIITILNKNVS